MLIVDLQFFSSVLFIIDLSNIKISGECCALSACR